MSRPGARRGLTAAGIALVVALAAHTTAAVALAECNGGLVYEATVADVPGGPWDLYYTIGHTVTAAQVANFARDLPDTDTAAAPVAEPRPDPGWPPAPVILIGFAPVAWVLLRYAIPANRSVSGGVASTRDSRRM